MARPWRLMLPLLLLYSPIVSSQEVQDNDPTTLFKRASEMMSLRKYDGALGLLNAVLEVDPNHSEAYRQRASVLRHRCRYKDAESDYNKYLELKPQTASVEKELSQLLQAKNALESAYSQSDAGDFSKVLEYLNKIVLVFSPSCSKAKLLKAKALLALKDYSSVISETGFILKEDEDDLDALLLRGRAYYYLADHDVANRHYQKGLRLDPEHSELKKAYFGLKKLLKKTKSAEDNAAKSKLRMAAEDYKAALAMDPDHTLYNVNLYLGLCKTLVKLGRGKEAINSCTEALSIDEELVDALAQRGEAKLLTEDWEGAVEDLKEAAQKSPQAEITQSDEALLKAEQLLQAEVERRETLEAEVKTLKKDVSTYKKKYNAAQSSLNNLSAQITDTYRILLSANLATPEENAITQAKTLKTVLRTFFAGTKLLLDAIKWPSEVYPGEDNLMQAFSTVPGWIEIMKRSACRIGMTRALTLAKAYFPKLDPAKVTSGFPEFKADGSKFEPKDFKDIQRAVRSSATTLADKMELDKIMSSYDAEGKVILVDAPPPFDMVERWSTDLARRKEEAAKREAELGAKPSTSTPAVPPPVRPDVKSPSKTADKAKEQVQDLDPEDRSQDAE